MSSDDKANGVFLDDLVQHFRELAERLQRIDSAVPPKGLAPAFVERRRDLEGLAAVASFLKKTNVGDDIAKRFGDLAGYLSDLDKGGRPDSVLMPATRSGRSVDPWKFWHERSNVSLGLEGLISAGQLEDHAAKYAARRYPQLKRLVLVRKNKKEDLAGSVLSWRRACRAGAVKDVPVQNAFSKNYPVFLQELNALDIKNRKMLADNLLSATARRAEGMVAPQGDDFQWPA